VHIRATFLWGIRPCISVDCHQQFRVNWLVSWKWTHRILRSFGTDLQNSGKIVNWMQKGQTHQQTLKKERHSNKPWRWRGTVNISYSSTYLKGFRFNSGNTRLIIHVRVWLLSSLHLLNSTVHKIFTKGFREMYSVSACEWKISYVSS
jgi:hypothetical protein